MTFAYSDLLGVPYVHRGRDPAVGLDCLGLLLVVYRRLGINLGEPAIEYSPGWAERGEGLLTAKFLGEHFPQVFRAVPAAIQLGDIAVLSQAKTEPQHIVVNVGDGILLHVGRERGIVAMRWPVVKSWASACYRYYGAVTS